MLDNKEKLNEIFDAFRIRSRCVNHAKIRNISLYDIELDIGDQIRNIEKLSPEIKLHLKSISDPIFKISQPSGSLQIEVMDERCGRISFTKFVPPMKAEYGIVPVWLGSSVNASDMWIDLARNPHMLVAGTTGSGKSTLLQTIILNVLRLNNVQSFLIDTKNIDFLNFKSNKKIHSFGNYKDAYENLLFLNSEMNKRYSILEKKSLSFERLNEIDNRSYPYYLLMIDEFADLIMQDRSGRLHEKLVLLTQKCRAAGILCIVATQRPTANILSGNIKANFPARLSCKVASKIDSRVILDVGGAERLSGAGDAIINNYNNNYSRFQIAYPE